MKKVTQVKDFDAIAVSVASPEDILSWSHGEVTKPETINYRTQKPERDGLFCERIFGPVKNWECACGKYKRIRYRGITCERCGVEVTRSIVRRERMGHIKLAVPVTHTWFLRSTPSRIGLLLDLSVKELEQIVYFAIYIIVDVDNEMKQETIVELETEYKKLIDSAKEENAQSLKAAKSAIKSGDMKEKDLISLEESIAQDMEDLTLKLKIAQEELNGLQIGQTLTETDYRNISMKFGHVFRAGIGADALREIIQKMDLEKVTEQLKEDYKNSSGQKQKKIMKRQKLVSSLMRNDIRPEWMILTVIPVIPPELRPMVQLDGGRFATSDLNDLYRRVINRNARLKKLIQLGAPEIICRNEKRMLQEAVDILISNSPRNSSRSGMNYVQKRKLRSLSDMLKGKQGRFRQNLLGKRVDFSGRSVIVVGPTLRLHECGIPKKIALELFKPFVISELIKLELVHNVKSAEKLIKQADKIVWDLLDQVIKGKYVLLNRAPTLHRMGIQAFQPRLIEGKAIQLHPLVCAAFNADFDGDQMAVHLPLSEKAQEEARTIMVSAKNLLKPSSGEPIIDPSQDMVLGCFFLTSVFEGKKGEGMTFPNEDEVITAFEQDLVHLQAVMKIRTDKEGIIETSVGRVLFNRILPKELEYQNKTFDKKQLKKILARTYADYGVEPTVAAADAIKDLGFAYATKSGISISAYDFHAPEEKSLIIKKADSVVSHINELYRFGLMTDDERYTQTIRIWGKVKTEVTNEMIKNYDPQNDITYQVVSGARGNWGQITQISGMKGLVASPSGKTIELPIKSNLKEGFSILEYFIATHGGRKGKSDTALKTAEAGYLTRRLVDSVQDTVIREEDCGVDISKLVTRENSVEVGVAFETRLYGRVIAEDVLVKNEVVLEKNSVIDHEALEIIGDHQLIEIPVRSVMYCHTSGGVCQKCYGYDLGNNKTAQIGTPVGIIAAQSIGEPGTQLTMRTFHMGGVATEEASITQGLTRVDELFEARTPKNPAVLAEINGDINVKRLKNETQIHIQATETEPEDHHLSHEFMPAVKEGDIVKEKQIIARSTETKSTIKSKIAGKVTQANENNIEVTPNEPQERSYTVSSRATLKVKNGDTVKKGQPLVVGHIDLRELMELTSIEKAQEYILYEVQGIYTSQGQDINEKHIEIIVKQMASKMRVEDVGESDWLPGEVKDVIDVMKTNQSLEAEGKRTVVTERLLLGLTRISLWTDSWLSAASFQETIRVLVEASTTKKHDTLDGLKENVIIGRLIPAGEHYRDLIEEGKLEA